VTKKDVLAMRIDQSTKIAATTFLRCLDESIADHRRACSGLFYEVSEIKAEKVKPEHWAAASDHRHRDGRGARARRSPDRRGERGEDHGSSLKKVRSSRTPATC
jgi:hypothetical protein